MTIFIKVVVKVIHFLHPFGRKVSKPPAGGHLRPVQPSCPKKENVQVFQFCGSGKCGYTARFKSPPGICDRVLQL
jgi:hypothetical protein